MRAYLEYWGEYHNSLTPPEEHEHEVGDDRSGCCNCRLAELGVSMTAFERAAWNWYQDNVSPFAIEAGLVADEVRAEGLTGRAKRMFVRLLGMIHATTNRIAHERAKAQAQALAAAQEA